VCLLVITIDDAVARWAEKFIEVGPGTRCKPWVVGPSNMPAVTDLRQAAAIVASADIDSDRSRLYLDLLLISLAQSAPEGFEDIVKNSLGFEYQSDFARRYVAQGLAEGREEGREEGRTQGRMEGRLDVILKLLAARFGPLPEAVQTRVRGAQDAQLDTLAERLFTAQTLEQALGSI
jgi:hypothetical protein